MYTKRIERIDEIPVPEHQRRCTDLTCLVLWILFVCIMLVSAILQFNKQNLYKINFPTDSDYRGCGYELDNYPYLYFLSPTGNDISRRVCVNQCPRAGAVSLICSPTSTIQCAGPSVNIYDTSPIIDRLGAFCVPTDPQLLRSALLSYNLVDKWNFLKSLDVIKWSLALSLLLGVLYFIAVQCAPKGMIWVGMIISGVLAIVLGLIFLSDQSYSFSRHRSTVRLAGLLSIVSGIVLLGFTWWSSHQIRVCSVFVQAATQFVRQSKSVILYIPLFIVASFAFITLILFQYLSYSSSTPIFINPGDIYWNGSRLTVWNFLNAIQFLWGIFILRDAFNFVTSGNSIEWYFTHNTTNCCTPFARLIRKNLGSVVGGAFLNCFFAIPQLIIDLFKPSEDGKCKKIVQPCFCICGALLNTLNLIRTDAYSYINLTGIPYCNAARQCEYICHRSPVFEGSQSAIRIYRVGSHIMIIALVLIMSYFGSKFLLLNNDVSVMALGCVFFVTYCTAAYFLLVHLDAAEGIMTSFLTQHQLANQDYAGLRFCPPEIKHQMQELQNQHNMRFG